MSDNPINDLTPETVEAIQKDAKRTFSLRNRLQDQKVKREKQLIFTDSDAIEAFEEAQEKLTLAGNEVDNFRTLIVEDDGEVTPEQQASLRELVEKYNSVESEVDDRKAELLSSAISVHLIALPDVATKKCRREARKGATGRDKVLDEELFNELMAKNLLNLSIEKIVDATGAEAEPEVDEETGNPVPWADVLQGFLPSSQWQRLDLKVASLQFRDTIGSIATEEPGF